MIINTLFLTSAEKASENPCHPTPCGPNSQCRVYNKQAVCSCLFNYIGIPPVCRPECTINSDCPRHLSCINQKCVNSCLGACGIKAECQVVNHVPFCKCMPGYTGNAFVMCQILPLLLTSSEIVNPCAPSPCGPNAQCTKVQNSTSCACLANYKGAPPNCRPECLISSECADNMACINNNCRDPCQNLCGENAICQVISHAPSCMCLTGYLGDPFTQCLPSTKITQQQANPCSPSPCGNNAECRQKDGAGSCACLPDFYGNPYEGCRPECVLNSDCPPNRACQNQKCLDPCPGVCGQNAQCNVINHLPRCSCSNGYSGDPYKYCNVFKDCKIFDEIMRIFQYHITFKLHCLVILLIHYIRGQPTKLRKARNGHCVRFLSLFASKKKLFFTAANQMRSSRSVTRPR